ncbi:MAG: DUF1294 domain-containing protein [Alkalibacterium sp.]|nr:DUF1294 domain-containing protein [Alkalibacterium sp.]
MTTLTIQQLLILSVIVLLNLRSLYLFYSDKQRAIKKNYRISERTLLLSAALLGGLGAWAGMTLFRHKTKRTVFKICVPISGMLTSIALIAVIIFNHL